MHLQGNLQLVFDALFRMGVIEPVLKKDWAAIHSEALNPRTLERAVTVANGHQSDVHDLIGELKKFDQTTLEKLAMEVAREYAGFHTRTELQ